METHSNPNSGHLIAEFIGDPQGPTLIVFGSIHGNEAAGAAALERVAASMLADPPPLKGRAYFFRGNIRAINKGVRFIDRDLNRHWSHDNVIRNLPDTEIPPHFSEDKEQAELLLKLDEILRTAENEVYALDLHSTSAKGVPFATVGDTLRNRAFAQKFPVTILLGIEEQLEGTLLEYLNNLGVVTLGYEGGQHYAESTIAIHEALTWRAMANAGMIGYSDKLEEFDHTLRSATGHPRIVEVRYRHAITASDEFSMLPGFNNFDPIRKGYELAGERTGKIKAAEDGVILMPLYQKQGEDGFFVGREVAPFWIWLSGVLRWLRIGSLMRFLPGVHRSQNDPDTFEIDTSIARYFPLQIFHLLGFRKRRWRNKKLVVSRRRFDTNSPFRKL